MSQYIYQLPDWPHFYWDQAKLAPLLSQVRYHQGHVLGRMEMLGFTTRREAVLQSLTDEVIKSSEIEGEILDPMQVRSSIARRLGIPLGINYPKDRNVEGMVEMMLDATQNFDTPLTEERLFNWHIALFVADYRAFNLGGWRDDAVGPMQVVSGPISREHVHFEAPPAKQLAHEMQVFIDWLNMPQEVDPIIKAAIAHLWFVTIHPFEDGNGRIGRAITDWVLARAEQSAQRFYSMSAQIKQERKSYYHILEMTQKGTLDITAWLEWFLQCLDHAFERTENAVKLVLQKSQFWERYKNASINERQRLILNKLLDNFEGKLTTTKWAKIAKCSQDTALRDIDNLIAQGILVKDSAGGRSTSYSLNSS